MTNSCKGCGAKIEYAAGTQSLTCTYCGAVNEIARPEDELATSVDLILPLTVTQEALDMQVYHYMASGDYTPDDMLESAVISLRERGYFPAFSFDIDYKATWTASFGFDRKEPYTAYRTVMKNGNSHQEAYTAYRTVTDWRPANGTDEGIFTVSTYAGSKLASVALSPESLIPGMIANGGLTEFNPSFVSGFELEAFSVPETKALDSLNDEVNHAIDMRVQKHGQGDHQQDWHWNAKMQHRTSTVAVPLCHAVFDHEGKEYNLWIDGVGGNGMRADPLPVDQEKQKEVKKGGIPALVGAAALVGSAANWSLAGTSLIAVGLAGGYYWMRRRALIDYSKTIRQSLLTQLTASSTVASNLSEEEQAKVARAFQRPERPLFARIHKDKIVLPVFSALVLIGAVLPNYMASPQYAYRQQVAAEAAMEKAYAEKEATRQQAAEQQAAEQAAAQQAAEKQAAEQEAAKQAAEQAAEQTAREEAAKQAAEQQAAQQAAEQAAAPAAPAAAPVQDGPYLAKADLNAILGAATENNWTAVDAKVKSVKLRPLPPVDTAASDNTLQKVAKFLEAKEPARAIALLEEGIKTSPGDLKLRNNLTNLYLRQNKLNEALQTVTANLLLNPAQGPAWFFAADVFANLDKAAESAAALKLAIHFVPDRANSISYITSDKYPASAKFKAALSQTSGQFQSVPAFSR